VVVQVAALHDAEREQRDDGVVEAHGDPHVPQRLLKHARRLLLHKVRRRLEAADAEQARRDAWSTPQTQAVAGTHAATATNNDVSNSSVKRTR
jgi:hypothetical protein